MNNAAVLMNSVLRLRFALKREEDESSAASSCLAEAARYQWEG